VLTPSSRRLCRHHRHLLCRRLRLPLPHRLLPRLALVEGGHRQLPTDQTGLIRGILDVFRSCPIVRPWQTQRAKPSFRFGGHYKATYNLAVVAPAKRETACLQDGRLCQVMPGGAMKAGAYRVYEDPNDLLLHLDEIGIRGNM